MSYQVATIRLKDGRVYERAVIVGGEITSIAGDPQIPFTEPEIAELIVTNDISWRR